VGLGDVYKRQALPWDYITLAIFALVLIVVGVLVGMAANVNILPQGA